MLHNIIGLSKGEEKKKSQNKNQKLDKVETTDTPLNYNLVVPFAPYKFYCT